MRRSTPRLNRCRATSGSWDMRRIMAAPERIDIRALPPAGPRRAQPRSSALLALLALLPVVGLAGLFRLGLVGLALLRLRLGLGLGLDSGVRRRARPRHRRPGSRQGS